MEFYDAKILVSKDHLNDVANDSLHYASTNYKIVQSLNNDFFKLLCFFWCQFANTNQNFFQYQWITLENKHYFYVKFAIKIIVFIAERYFLFLFVICYQMFYRNFLNQWNFFFDKGIVTRLNFRRHFSFEITVLQHLFAVDSNGPKFNEFAF